MGEREITAILGRLLDNLGEMAFIYETPKSSHCHMYESQLFMNGSTYSKLTVLDR